MLARLCAFVIWALVAGCAVFWGLRLGVASRPAPGGAVVVESGRSARGDLVRLFGSAPPPSVAVAAAPPAESTRFRLSGLMAPRRAAPYGVALIAVDGKPARAFRVGTRVEGEMVLQSVSLRTATVGASGGGNSFTLEMPQLVPPSTGTLSPAANLNLNAGGPPGFNPNLNPNVGVNLNVPGQAFSTPAPLPPPPSDAPASQLRSEAEDPSHGGAMPQRSPQVSSSILTR